MDAAAVFYQRADQALTVVAAFSPQARAAVFEANLGQCAGCTRQAVEAHHRRPRGMGGSSDAAVGDPANGVPLCRSCHRWAETRRDEARRIGWLLAPGDDPAGVPWWASSWGFVRWVVEDDGCWLIELVQPKQG